MGCGKCWEDNLAEALAAGAIPDFEPDEQPAASPFAGANMAPSGSDWTCKMASPFATTPSFAALPKDIQDLVDERSKQERAGQEEGLGSHGRLQLQGQQVCQPVPGSLG